MQLIFLRKSDCLGVLCSFALFVEKVHKLEGGYRDCIKGQETRQGYTVYRMMHQALDDSDQTRKYGISDP